MLKKLVKYGNSNALVLDKALLELLNMTEGSVVKIKTDGVSLIITPQNVVAQENMAPTITPEKTLHEAIQTVQGTFCNKPEDAPAYMQELQKVFAKYAGSINKLETPEIQQAMQKIEQECNGNRLDPKYSKAVKSLRQKHAPELIEMDKEVHLLSQKYAKQEYQYPDKENVAKLAGLTLDFKKVHEKYSHVTQQVTQLFQNAEYIHESVLLAEKYHYTKNSPEYIQEYLALITKYIPEYATYQDEIKKVSETFNEK